MKEKLKHIHKSYAFFIKGCCHLQNHIYKVYENKQKGEERRGEELRQRGALENRPAEEEMDLQEEKTVK